MLIQKDNKLIHKSFVEDCGIFTVQMNQRIEEIDSNLMLGPFISTPIRIIDIENIFDYFENVLNDDLVVEQN